MKSYLLILILTIALLTLVLLTVNLTADPYFQYGTVEIENINKVKVAAGRNERLYKISTMNQLAPDTIILGTSRENYGIDPIHMGFHGGVYNGATALQPYRESRLTLDHLDTIKHYPKHILLGMMFEISDINLKLPGDFNEEILYGGWKSEFKTLLSIDTIKSSLETIKWNATDRQGKAPFYGKGLRLPSFFESLLGEKGHRRAFLENEKLYMRENHRPLPLCQANPFYERVSGYSRMDEIRKLISLAHAKNSDLRIFIGASHARQWETIKVSGLWDKFEEWKTFLVRINEEEAQMANSSPFPIWDFSGYNSITSEDVPLLSDTESRMKYYFESSHYTPLAGNLMIDRIYGTNRSQNSGENFGVLISSKNLSQHLRGMRSQQRFWEKGHPTDVSEILQLKREVDAAKQCAR